MQANVKQYSVLKIHEGMDMWN